MAGFSLRLFQTEPVNRCGTLWLNLFVIPDGAGIALLNAHAYRGCGKENNHVG
jgi:hypothetical protein